MNSPILIAIYWLIVLSISLVIIAENRNPVKAVAWILVVLLLPIVGIVLYVFFGEDLRHVRIIDKRIYSRISHIPFRLQSKIHSHHIPYEYDTPLKRIVKKVADSPLLPFSNLSIFTSGKAKFDHFLEDLKRAKQHIHLEYYSFMDDALSSQVATILKEKAQEGVAVRVIYDDVGSWHTKKRFWLSLRQAHVEAFPFMRVIFPFLSSRVNYRNHRKLAVIDGKIGYVGGMNISNKYVKGDALGAWRDTHFRLEGAAVSLLQSSFILDWHLVTQQLLDVNDYFPSLSTLPETIPPETIPLMQLIAGEPVGKWRTIEQAITTLAMTAKKSMIIETPYFLPTENLNSALINAALAGIKIKLLIPFKSDVPTVHLASLSYIEEFLEVGIEVYQYQKGFLHSKLISVDGEIAVGGSANLDFRSFEHNFELLALFYDKATAKKIEEIFNEDLLKSKKIDPEEWKNRSRIKRFGESLMRLFSPLM